MSELVRGRPLDITVDAIVNWMDNVGSQIIGDLEGIVPSLLYAFIIAIAGVIAAKAVGYFVKGAADRIDLDDMVEHSVFGDAVLDEEQTAGDILATIAVVYVYLLTALLVASELGLGRVAGALNGVVGFIPTAVVALVVLAAGFWLADVAQRRVEAAAPAESPQVAQLFGLAIQVFVYLVAIAVGFGVFAGTSGGAGFAIPIVQAFALGFALAFGLAIGWGAKEYLGNETEPASADD